MMQKWPKMVSGILTMSLGLPDWKLRKISSDGACRKGTGVKLWFFYIDPKVRLFLINRHDHPSINKEGSPFHDGGMTTPHWLDATQEFQVLCVASFESCRSGSPTSPWVLFKGICGCRRSWNLSSCTLWWFKIAIPNAPCMEYLPTFTPKMAQKWIHIPYIIHGASGYWKWPICRVDLAMKDDEKSMVILTVVFCSRTVQHLENPKSSAILLAQLWSWNQEYAETKNAWPKGKRASLGMYSSFVALHEYAFDFYSNVVFMNCHELLSVTLRGGY